ncbi:MAG TPA: DUF4331 domain-containing protein [Gaiellaceae bacterium]|jgi:hypothetical protein|nr:DUF4331 domain-containing protein [Gaiellaceae bacterium]
MKSFPRPTGLPLIALVAVGAVALATVAMLTGASAPDRALAASHREAPLIALDPAADITDFFAFRSYEPGKADKVVLIMDVMSEEPSSGPNYWNFDPSVTYSFNVDNDQDGKADDVELDFHFKTELRGTSDSLGLFLPYVALPPVTALDGPGSEGIGLRQTYSITMKSGPGKNTQTLAEGLIAVPSNVGPRTMPNYSALAAQGVYSLDGGIRVFAGQRDDPFYIDLGATFDTLNLRSPGVDMLSGFNVHEIALEVPATLLTGDTGGTVIGAYAATSRPRETVRGKDGTVEGHGGDVQVQRLANPLVNEVLIGTKDKDRWNATEPEDEAQFVDYYDNPRFATALEAVFGADANPLFPLRDVFLKYGASDTHLSELLRLNLAVAPTPLASQERLTVLAGDNAGWPNGRRPIDDVTDIAVQVVGGTNYAGAGDNVNANDVALPTAFPFLATPHDGRNRVHANP